MLGKIYVSHIFIKVPFFDFVRDTINKLLYLNKRTNRLNWLNYRASDPVLRNRAPLGAYFIKNQGEMLYDKLEESKRKMPNERNYKD